jgi:hypothetical protein
MDRDGKSRSRSARFPPPFSEVVEETGSQGVDLAYDAAFVRQNACHLQLRDSTGLTPVSPFSPPIRGWGRRRTHIQFMEFYA